MSQRANTFYITTAIDYPNSVPHMGHAYEKVVADFYARASRLRGVETRFLIGLDEHGQKIQESAEQAGKAPQAFVDEKAVVFRELYRLLEVSCDDFVRTSEPRHRRYAAWLYERVRDRGDIYKGVYQAEYCISCEKPLQKSELVGGKCPIHERPTTQIEEESYFFRLGKYRDAVREHIESHPEFISPSERRNEVLSRLRDEVRDLSISRSSFHWGVPLPDDPGHVLYVWFDALSNYISALREPEDIEARFWPADCHVIGKDILWFHTVIWPAMLLGAGIELPRQVYAHGFVLDQDGRKMSKHLDNVVDPLAVVQEYSVDVLRYYLLRAFSSSQDGNFSLEELDERYHRELGNDFGNLVMRVAKLARTKLGGAVAPPAGPLDLDPASTLRAYFDHVDSREHHRALDRLWSYVGEANAYLNQKRPWEQSDRGEVARTIYSCLEALRAIVHLLEPAMPASARAAARVLGFPLGRLDAIQPRSLSYSVAEASPLFPRRETPKAKAAQAPPQAAAEPAPSPAPPRDPFASLEIRVGRIEDVRDHPNAEKLYAMTVDIGGEKRSICAGLRQHLSLEELRGRSVVVLANLKPAKLRGIESQGMVLATDRSDGKVVPVDPGAAASGDHVRVESIEGVAPSAATQITLGDFERVALVMLGGRVTYGGKPLRTSSGSVTCDAPDGARVR
jgi:methionyl-tRNA synthetase